MPIFTPWIRIRIRICMDPDDALQHLLIHITGFKKGSKCTYKSFGVSFLLQSIRQRSGVGIFF